MGLQETQGGLLLCVYRHWTTSARGKQSLREPGASSTSKAVQQSNMQRLHTQQPLLTPRGGIWPVRTLPLKSKVSDTRPPGQREEQAPSHWGQGHWAFWDLLHQSSLESSLGHQKQEEQPLVGEWWLKRKALFQSRESSFEGSKGTWYPPTHPGTLATVS